MILVPQRRLLRLPGVAIWKVFEFLGELVIYNSHHMNTNPEIKSYCRFCTYPNKDSSAWTEVWSGAWSSRASIMAPDAMKLVHIGNGIWEPSGAYGNEEMVCANVYPPPF